MRPDFGRHDECSRMVVGSGQDTLTVVFYPGHIRCYRGVAPWAEFLPGPLFGPVRDAFAAGDAFALSGLWMGFLAGEAAPVAPPAQPVPGAGGDDEPTTTSDC